MSFILYSMPNTGSHLNVQKASLGYFQAPDILYFIITPPKCLKKIENKPNAKCQNAKSAKK